LIRENFPFKAGKTILSKRSRARKGNQSRLIIPIVIPLQGLSWHTSTSGNKQKFKVVRRTEALCVKPPPWKPPPWNILHYRHFPNLQTIAILLDITNITTNKTISTLDVYPRRIFLSDKYFYSIHFATIILPSTSITLTPLTIPTLDSATSITLTPLTIPTLDSVSNKHFYNIHFPQLLCLRLLLH
jgi:hypothetical protein